MPNRWLVLVVAYSHTLLTAGVVFGWAALENILDKERLTISQRNLCFTLGGNANYLSNLIFGPVLDSYGARGCNALASLVMLSGSLVVAFADVTSNDTAYAASICAGFTLLGLGGPGIQIPTLRVASLFPEFTELIGSLNASLFDASCVVFLLFQILHSSFHISFRMLFIGYSATIVLICVSSLLLFECLELPRKTVAATSSKEADILPLLSTDEDSSRSASQITYEINSQAPGREVDVERAKATLVTVPIPLMSAGPGSAGTAVLQSGSYEYSRMAEGGGSLRSLGSENSFERYYMLSASAESEGATASTRPASYGRSAEGDARKKSISHSGLCKSESANDLATPLLPGEPAGQLLPDVAVSDFLPAKVEEQCDVEPIECDGKAAETSLRLTFKQAVRTPQFMYLAVFTSLHVLRLNFIVGTINTQLAHQMSDNRANSFETVFSLLLPLGGVSAPLTAWLLGNYQSAAYHVCTVFGVAYGLGLTYWSSDSLPGSMVVLYSTFGCVAVGRQLVYSIVFANTPSLFGYEHLGKLLAAVNLCVFSVGLLQFVLASLPSLAFGKDWWQINLIMACLPMPLLFFNKLSKVAA
ncbi:hypothetical protein CYMTET_19278 [Cymbomonas tetramitiformis]|uniref:Uncharacterized protein n=1 Tax=Cymbomonas tetramitiformis TaxID=36881 RepID=A0AAE0G6G5_9CHLO|nr:hypothetical protein CYMTET_19278 [Cymbomonas tetramitiformis]|eukprot:gene20176-24149_t